MNLIKRNSLLSIAIIIAIYSVSALTTFAQEITSNPLEEATQAKASSPQITNIIVKENGSNPIVEVRGLGFGKDPSKVKVMLNNNGVLLEPQEVKNKKLTLQVPNASLCSGFVALRVIVGANSSNQASFQYQKLAPIIYSITPSHAQAGAAVEIQADNLACNSVNNLVTLNDSPLQVLSVNTDKITVRIPDSFTTTGNSKVRLTVDSQSSLPKDFTLDPREQTNNNSNPTSDNTLKFLSSSQPGATFAPMFAIRDRVTNLSVSLTNASLWDANFYGTHQSIIDLPWKIDGVPQKALLTINCREANGLYGNSIDQKERFVYALIQFPKFPEKLYNSTNNPFFWGACSAETEGVPGGGLIFNSLGRATGGIDSFEIAKDASSPSKMNMTFRLIAPDLGYYEDYGINYSNAGNGQVKLPKIMTVSVEMTEVRPAIPASKFVVGRVTFTDFANGSMVTNDSRFENTFSITDVPDFGLGIFR